MILCPTCGTANPIGSRHCMECGLRFDPPTQECPDCRTLNPIGDLVCAACGADLPAQPAVSVSWNERPPGQSRAAAEPPPPTPDEIALQAKDTTEVPDWTQDLPVPLAVDVPQAAEADVEAGEPEGLLGLQTSAQEAAPLIVEAMIGEAQPPTADLPAEGSPPARPPSPGPDLEREDGDQATGKPSGSLPALGPDKPGREEEGETQRSTLVTGEVGLLAVIKGTLPAEALIAQPYAAIADAGSEGIASSQDREAMAAQARLFSEIVAPPAGATPQTTGQPRVRQSLGIVVFPLTESSSYSLPFLLEEPLLSYLPESLLQRAPFLPGTGLKEPLPRTFEAAPAVADLYEQIESLGSDAHVLVAFDYDPSSIGEMDVVARDILGHLMDRDAQVVAVSLLPAGAATAQHLLEELAAGRYVNLGYLPGQAVAVRRLGRSLQTALPHDFLGNPVVDLDVMEGMTSLQSFELIIELAAAQDTLRWWIEQAGTPYDVPLGAGVSASVEPMARTYYETEPRQLVGLLGGVSGAATYQALRSDQRTGSGPQDRPQDDITDRLDAQLAGHLFLVLVILIGNGVYLVQRVIGRGS